MMKVDLKDFKVVTEDLINLVDLGHVEYGGHGILLWGLLQADNK